MNDFERICKDLEKRKKACGNHCCLGNNYLCARYMVNQYILNGFNNKDKNRLLLLKSEYKESFCENSYSLLVSIVSMAICTLTLLFTIIEKLLENDNLGIFCFGLFLLLALFIYCIILISVC